MTASDSGAARGSWRLLVAICVSTLVVLACSPSSASASVAVQMRPYPSGVAATGCHLAEYGGRQLAFGETWPAPDQCMAIRCRRSGPMPDGARAFMLTFMGCGSAAAMRPCKVTAASDLPYPACCPTIECPDGNNNLEYGEQQRYPEF